MRPDYCPIGGEPCQSLCVTPCLVVKKKPLSAEEIEQCCYEADSKTADHPQTWKWTEAFARAIEAAHGIKEGK